MVDRITPVTADADREWLRDRAGIDDRWPVVAEPFRQWVMEDDFAGGRPPWEQAGALFTDRIDDWELYKLRLLNAGHSCMAYLSALAGITFVHEAMAVPAIADVHGRAPASRGNARHSPRSPAIRGRSTSRPSCERFANPGVRDQIARVCIDGSAKFPTFLIPTIARQLERRRADRARHDGAGGLGALPRRRRSGGAVVRLRRGRGAAPRRRGRRRSGRVPGVRSRVPARAAGFAPVPGGVRGGLPPDRRERPDRGDRARPGARAHRRRPADGRPQQRRDGCSTIASRRSTCWPCGRARSTSRISPAATA